MPPSAVPCAFRSVQVLNKKDKVVRFASSIRNDMTVRPGPFAATPLYLFDLTYLVLPNFFGVEEDLVGRPAPHRDVVDGCAAARMHASW